MKKIYPLIVLSIISFFIGLIVGMRFFTEECENKEDKKVVTSQSVHEKISDESFLITKSVLVNQETERKSDNGWWKELWFKDEVMARALVSIDIGVDLSRLTEKDITIDEENKRIIVDLPEAEVRETTLNCEIEVETESGIITTFTRDKNEDYNDAIEMLKKASVDSLEDNQTIFIEARNEALNIIKLVLKDFDYEVILVAPTTEEDTTQDDQTTEEDDTSIEEPEN